MKRIVNLVGEVTSDGQRLILDESQARFMLKELEACVEGFDKFKRPLSAPPAAERGWRDGLNGVTPRDTSDEYIRAYRNAKRLNGLSGNQT